MRCFRLTTTAALIGLLLLFCADGCKKGRGERCAAPSDCEKGYGCVGDPDSRCERCEEWSGCIDKGLCSSSEGRCLAAADEDCELSKVCKERGRCTASMGGCVREVRYQSGDNNEGGCPCGCDRSQAMVAELADAGAPHATAIIASTLATIAERERAGYITEAMVQHRLRLLELRRSLGDEDELPLMDLHGPVQPFHAEPVALGELSLRSELVLYGQTVEIIHGRVKPQRACFLWRLGVENRGEQPVVLPKPTIRSQLPFTVSRWYLEGSDGQPWDGQLAVGQSRVALIIGYIDEAVKPGTEIAATLELRGAAIPTTARARQRWDQVD